MSLPSQTLSEEARDRSNFWIGLVVVTVIYATAVLMLKALFL